MNAACSRAVRRAKRASVALIGGTVLLAGIVLLVLPGPAFLVIPAGLAILATEFAWARRWLKKVRDCASAAATRAADHRAADKEATKQPPPGHG